MFTPPRHYKEAREIFLQNAPPRSELILGTARPQNGSPHSARGADCFSGILPWLLSTGHNVLHWRFTKEFIGF